MSSTTAGAKFGFSLIGLILLTNLVKYPFLLVGTRFTAVTGLSLLEGFQKRKIHIFGLSYFSHFHQRALTEKCSQYRDIHVYALNPCMEFWENLQSVWEKKQELREKLDRYRKYFQEDTQISKADLEAGELIRNEEENPFLQAWGRPGRENIRLLNEWKEWQFDEHFTDPLESSSDPPSMLRQIQHDEDKISTGTGSKHPVVGLHQSQT